MAEGVSVTPGKDKFGPQAIAHLFSVPTYELSPCGCSLSLLVSGDSYRDLSWGEKAAQCPAITHQISKQKGPQSPILVPSLARVLP